MTVATLDDLRLGSRRLSTELGDAVTDGTLERTIEGASTLTLTVHDPAGDLLNGRTRYGPLIREDYLDVELDGQGYRLVKLGRQGSALSLTFEDRVVARLREFDDPLSANRADTTRAQFARSLVAEARPRITFRCPEVNDEQPIARGSRAGNPPASSSTAVTNLLMIGDSLTVGTLPAMRASRKVEGNGRVGRPSSEALSVLRELVRDRHDAVIFDAGTNDDPSDAEGYRRRLEQAARIVGRRQLIVATLNRPGVSSLNAAVRNFAASSGATLVDWAGVSRREGLLVGDGIHATPNGYRRRARLFLDALGGPPVASSAGRGSSGSPARNKPYRFRRGDAGKREDTWTCLGRLAEEVAWRRYVVRGEVWFVSERWLRRQRPSYLVREDAAGVNEVSFDLDLGKRVAEANVSVVLGRWQAPPGTVVKLEGYGPADGIWLVSSVSAPLYSEFGEVVLRRPQDPKPEPAPETITSSGTTRVRLGPDSDTGRESPKGSLDGVKVRPRYWAGTKSLFTQFVTPFMQRQGLSAGSAKRTPSENAAVGGSPTSDHLTTNRNTYAVDYPTLSGAGAAAALARAMDAEGAYVYNGYGGATITVDGYRFRVQILWGAGIGHGDHVHVGIERA